MSIPDCAPIDPLVTSYVDGEISTTDRELVDQHLGQCGSCRTRVLAERSVRGLLHAKRSGLVTDRASDLLRTRIADTVRQAPPATVPLAWPARLAPYAMAATLVLIVGGAFLYQATQMSTRVMAAELAADHVKCFLMNDVLGTNHTHDDVEVAMASDFDWDVQLPDRLDEAGLALVGSRLCLYGQGRVAHLMYQHEGRPVSVFMLPDASRGEESLAVLGHEAAIWSEGNRTFVLVAREPRADVQRMASFVHSSLR